MSHVTRENGMGELLGAVIVFFSLSLHRPGFYEEFVLVKVVEKKDRICDTNAEWLCFPELWCYYFPLKFGCIKNVFPKQSCEQSYYCIGKVSLNDNYQFVLPN